MNQIPNQTIMIGALMNNQHCLEINKYFMWHDSQLRRKSFWWEKMALILTLEHMQDPPAYIPGTSSFNKNI